MTKEEELLFVAKIYHTIYPTSNFHRMNLYSKQNWMNAIKELIKAEVINQPT